MAKYERWVTLGWGVVGPQVSGIRHQARALGLKLEPFPWASAFSAEETFTVRVEGEPGAVQKFAEYMMRAGLDGPVTTHPR